MKPKKPPVPTTVDQALAAAIGFCDPRLEEELWHGEEVSDLLRELQECLVLELRPMFKRDQRVPRTYAPNTADILLTMYRVAHEFFNGGELAPLSEVEQARVDDVKERFRQIEDLLYPTEQAGRGR